MTGETDREKLLGALAAHGGTAGNQKLRTFVGWDEERYAAARDALLAKAVIVAGRGRRGSISLAVEAAAEANASPTMPDQAMQASATPQTSRSAKSNGGNLGFEAELFKTADKLRGNMEPSDYKHVALGLIFLKHISDGFEAKRAELLADYPAGAEDPECTLSGYRRAKWNDLNGGAKAAVAFFGPAR